MTTYNLSIKDGAFTFTPNEPLPQHVVFASPVTGVVGDVWGGDWFDATGYATYYTSSGTPAYHTGVDLNRPNYVDSGKPVYASFDGQIVYSGVIQGWQAHVVVIEHVITPTLTVWTRYAHIDNVLGLGMIKRGNRIGIIADYNKDGARGDHLHYDVAKIDLSKRPGDWPGADKQRVIDDYYDPVAWHQEYKGE